MLYEKKYGGLTMGGVFTFLLIGIVILTFHFIITKAAVKAGIREYKHEEKMKERERMRDKL